MPFLQRYCTSRHHSDSAVILLNISVFISVWVLATAVLFAVASTVSDCSFTVPIFYFCSQQPSLQNISSARADPLTFWLQRKRWVVSRAESQRQVRIFSGYEFVKYFWLQRNCWLIAELSLERQPSWKSDFSLTWRLVIFSIDVSF